ncbi:hypothetical protein D3C86_2175720 [compost metagenome]
MDTLALQSCAKLGQLGLESILTHGSLRREMSYKLTVLHGECYVNLAQCFRSQSQTGFR